MKRSLGIFESTQITANEAFSFNLVVAIGLSGAPSPETVRKALASLRERHPLLRARVVDEGGCRQFDFEDTPPIPCTVIPRVSEGDWQGVVEDELENRFDVAVGPLFRVVYLAPAAPDADAELIFTAQHVIVDAASAATLVREVLSLCAADGADEPPPDTSPLPVMPAAEDLFPERFKGWRGFVRRANLVLRQMLDEVRYRYRARGTRRPPLHPSGRSRILPLQLSVETSRALVRRCRRERVTINSALCAALLVAVQRNLYGGQETPLRNFVFAGLRPYLTPPLGAEHLGSCFAMMRFTTRVRRDAALWALAKEINQQIYEAGRRGEKFTNLLMSRAVMTMLFRLRSFRMASTALSYTGVAEIPESYGPIRIRRLHGFVSNFVLGPEYTAQVRLFAGRLWWDIVYLDSDMDEATARHLTEDIFKLLEAEATTQDGVSP